MKTKDEIRRESWRRMNIIEEAYGGLYRLPNYVMTAYRLYSLLAHASIEQYWSAFGYMPIDTVEIADAKNEFNWGAITDFEREVIALLNEACRRFEARGREMLAVVAI